MLDYKTFEMQDSYLEIPAEVSKISASFSFYIQTSSATCVVKVYGDCFENWLQKEFASQWGVW